MGFTNARPFDYYMLQVNGRDQSLGQSHIFNNLTSKTVRGFPQTLPVPCRSYPHAVARNQDAYFFFSAFQTVREIARPQNGQKLIGYKFGRSSGERTA